MSGPYFSGQQPSSCGHYYPDVLRLRDERRLDGTFVRIMECSYCGKYEFQLNARTLDKELVHKLNKKGFDIGIKEENVSEVRKQELKRLAAEAENKKKAFLKLQSILDGAIKDSADSVVLEYADKGLEVTYMFGNTGIGNMLVDRTLEIEIIELIVERAKLQKKSHGIMDWTYGDKLYKIKVEEYENFGETAFKLKLGKLKRKRA